MMEMNLEQLVKSRDVEAIKAYMAEHNMVVRDGKIVPASEGSKSALKAKSSFWNQRQQARKILLNSLYGALLNEGLRFYDERVGQSVTLTGRSIVRHMNAKVNEVITGEYDYTGEAIVYADTDSCYFTAIDIWKRNPEYSNVEWSRENVIQLYDGVAEEVNDSFPAFMKRSFNTSIARGGIIKAGRELVASAGLFIKKKKYGLLKYEEEGFRLDVGNSPGKMKAMGLDLKRADTPKFMQKFLEKILLGVLTNEPRKSLLDSIKNFRTAFKDRPAWEKGSPKKVSGLSEYSGKLDRATHASLNTPSTGKVSMPGHVRASMNWNRLCEANNDRYSMRITDGTRLVVCKLLPNPMRMESVAYPIDEPHLPQWFKQLPFDHSAMEEVIVDNKIDNLLGVLNWDFSSTKGGLDDDLFS